jgi:hypothetical protein
MKRPRNIAAPDLVSLALDRAQSRRARERCEKASAALLKRLERHHGGDRHSHAGGKPGAGSQVERRP